jgi:hypothetical protein
VKEEDVIDKGKFEREAEAVTVRQEDKDQDDLELLTNTGRQE